jgi:Niemann-Pick C1 protein
MNCAAASTRGWSAASRACGSVRASAASSLRDFCAGPLARAVVGRSARTRSRSPPLSPRRALSSREDDADAAARARRRLRRNPAVSALVTVTVLALACLGLLAADFARDVDDVWVPRGSSALAQKRESERAFGADPFSRPARVIVHVPGSEGLGSSRGGRGGCPSTEDTDGMLADAARVRAAFAVDAAARAVAVAADVDADAVTTRSVTFDDLCARARPMDKTSECLAFTPLAFWPSGVGGVPTNATTEELRDDVTATLYSGPMPVERRRVLGCVTESVNPNDGDQTRSRLCDAGAFVFTYFLDPASAPAETLERWERAFIETMRALNEDGGVGVRVVANAEISASLEIEAQERSDFGVLVGCYVMMTVAVTFFLTRRGELARMHQRILPALAGVALVALAAAATLGLTATFLELTPIAVQVVPYLLVAVGVDNVFIVAKQFDLALDRAEEEEEEEDASDDANANDADANDARAPDSRRETPSSRALRNATAMAEGLGVLVPSVGITSLTSCVALLVAGTTDVPALRSFCLTAGVGVALALVPIVTVFPGVLIACETAFGSSSSSSPSGRRRRHRRGVEPEPESGEVLVLHPPSPPSLLPTAACYVRVVDRLPVQIVVVAAYLAALFVSAFAATKVVAGIEPREMARAGSDLDAYLRVEAACNSHMGPPVFIVIKGVDYFGANRAGVDAAMRELTRRVENDAHVDGPVFGWYDAFVDGWLPFNAGVGADDCDALRIFLNDAPEGEPFKHDVRVVADDDRACAIPISRLRTLHRPLRDSAETVDAMVSLRKAVDPEAIARAVAAMNAPTMNAPTLNAAIDPANANAAAIEVDAYPISADYVYHEQFINQRRDHLTRVLAAIAAVGVIVFFAMNFYTAAIVVLALASVAATTFASTRALGLKLNAVSSVLLVAIIGLADEYVCHIMYSIVISEKMDVVDKVTDALRQFTKPVTAMGVTSVVGTALLAAASSPALRDYFFPLFAVAVAVSYAHGIVILPVVTLLCGRRKKGGDGSSTAASPVACAAARYD